MPCKKQSFEELYSAAFLRDIEENTDLELERFFHELNEEKYAFYARFLHVLQQRRLIQPDLPVELIDLFYPSGGYIDAPSATGRALCRRAAKVAARRIGIAATRFIRERIDKKRIEKFQIMNIQTAFR